MSALCFEPFGLNMGNVDWIGAKEREKLLCRYVTVVLEERKKGDCPQYASFMQELIQLLRQSAERQQEPQRKLLTLAHALANSVGVIHEAHHKDLCEEIFGIRLQKYPLDIAKVFIDVTLNMAWANSSLVVGCLRSLAIHLLPFDVSPKPSFDANGRWAPLEKITALQTVVLEALGKVVDMSPSLAPYLVNMLESKMPFVYRPTDAHGLYMRVLSQLMSYPYMASEKAELFAQGISHLLSIDAQFGDEIDKRDDEIDGKEDDDDEEDMLVHDDQFMLELEEQENPRGPREAAPIPLDKLDIFRRRDARVTMDVIMTLWLEHFEAKCTEGQMKEMWELMLSVFDARIVNTQRVRCTPFLMFYLCIRDENCRNDFVHHCMDKALDSTMPPSLRCSYVSYLSSFLARCALLSTRAVVDCLTSLMDECEQYARLVDQRDLHQGLWAIDTETTPATAARRSSQNTVFYSMIQGILYVLCYIMQEVFGKSDEATAGLAAELRDLVERRLGALLHHSLDPLNFCGPAIAVQFSHQAHVLGVLDCMDLVDIENLHRFGMKIEAFFPFDPYPLPHSSHFLKFDQTYVKWKDRKMNVDMETVYNAGHDDHDGTDEEALVYSSEARLIPRHRTCVGDEALGEFQEFSFSAGLTPMSVGTT